MDADQQIREQLIAARAGLVGKRREVDRQIMRVDRIIESLGAPVPTRSASPDPFAGVPTMRDAIIDTLASEPRAWRVNEIQDALEKLGVEAKEQSTRSILSKLVGEDILRNPARGFYKIKKVPTQLTGLP